MVDWKDVAIRAAKTFVQAFVGSLMTLLATGGTFENVLTQTALIAALSAGLSAAWNGVLNPALGVNTEKPPDSP